MRKELKDFNWHVYGLSLSDYEYTFQIVTEVIRDRKKQLQQKIDTLEVFDGDGNLIDLSTGEGDEAIDDISYYNYIENLYLWHFGLWRLQGVFEGILKQEFFHQEKLPGLKSKLDFIKKLNYRISQSDYDEILEWGKLRNALSHHPPEQYRPCELEEKDLKEYYELVKRITEDLLEQKEKNNDPTKTPMR
ncbi:hypothetical protein TH63_11035 [Rufibacter radiotolerans]|uniref:DUF4145 domain-containing protein n=1 Tax=Rufibacter radiotolerans TaxID=1379910 RepID=A0A0H4VQM2_9BACT|nr:hypothetical protein [Rufibacter radiotolerans]AKQ46054.1 hypothetical protein TH63_11035 [Rufibacter radiotolerans]